jgi:drug/metabolite transporter (DMT)-like permease
VQEVFQNLPENAGIQRISAAAGVIAMLGGASVVWAFDPSQTHILPVCPLYALTGFACPGCGLTRGFHALFHGDALTALDFNALIPLWTFVFGYLFLSLTLTALRGHGLPWRWVSPSMLFGFLVLLIGFGVIRNLPYYPFSVLFP